MKKCTMCGVKVYDDPLSNPTDDNGEPMCDNCFFETFAVCDECGGVTPDREMQIEGCRHCRAKEFGLFLNGETGRLEVYNSDENLTPLEYPLIKETFSDDKEAQKAADKFNLTVAGTYWPSWA